MRLRLLALLLPPALLVCGAACVTVGNREATPAADAPPALAQVEARFIPDPGRIAPELLEGQEFVQPHPIVTPLPHYPAAREDEPGPVVVLLRFVVGSDGAVREVRDSPLADPGGAPADAAFRQAAGDAVLSWLFVPAAIQTVKPGPDLDHDAKPDYTVLMDSNRVPVYLDVRFTFEIVAGERRVRAD
jgi:hypothetical protein